MSGISLQIYGNSVAVRLYSAVIKAWNATHSEGMALITAEKAQGS